MSIKCHWALAALNFKNDKRVTACPRNHSSMHDLAITKIPSQFVNSQGFRDLRKKLWNSQWPIECKSCSDFEAQGIRSYREQQNLDWWTDDLLSKFDATTGEISLENIEYIELRFSNACNLSCLHCTPSYSSKWQSLLKNETAQELDKKHKIHNILDNASNQSWTLDEVDHLVNDLIKNFPNLRRLDIAGGEPLYQKQFWKFLKGIIHHPNISHMEIVIVSNFNTPVNYIELSKLLLNFKNSLIRMSIDGSEKIYKYFRSGDYYKIKKNIELFRIHNKKTILEATNTISVYQLFDFEGTISDMATLPVDRLHHSFVQYPTYLSPTAIKDKTRIVEIINQSTSLSNSYSEKINKSLNKMIHKTLEFIKSSNFNQEDYDALVYYTERMDKIKNQSFEQVYGKPLEDYLNAR